MFPKIGERIAVCEHFDSSTPQCYCHTPRAQLLGSDIMTMEWVNWICVCSSCLFQDPGLYDCVDHFVTLVSVTEA